MREGGDAMDQGAPEGGSRGLSSRLLWGLMPGAGFLIPGAALLVVNHLKLVGTSVALAVGVPLGLGLVRVMGSDRYGYELRTRLQLVLRRSKIAVDFESENWITARVFLPQAVGLSLVVLSLRLMYLLWRAFLRLHF